MTRWQETNLGLIYAKGAGQRPDFVEATKWFRKAAEQGFPTGQASLGISYERGERVRQDNIPASDVAHACGRARGKEAEKARDNVSTRTTQGRNGCITHGNDHDAKHLWQLQWNDRIMGLSLRQARARP
jgi:Sel1 repeat